MAVVEVVRVSMSNLLQVCLYVVFVSELFSLYMHS